MSTEQLLLLAVLVSAVVLFILGRPRHDAVALAALLVATLLGLVAPAEAFAGFAHPAVTSIAFVLVLGRGLVGSGAADMLARYVLPRGSSGRRMTIMLCLLGAALSSAMNNVGALAILMPIAMRSARDGGMPPGAVLMPLSFSTLLGGMTTLIGTPPNLIVSAFREGSLGAPFGFFAFAPAGVAIAAAGVAFLALAGGLLLGSAARRRGGAADHAGLFELAPYIAEVHVSESSKAVGMTFEAVEAVLEKVGAQIIGVARGERLLAISDYGAITRAGDILIVEAEPEGLAAAVSNLGLSVEEAQEEKRSPRIPGRESEGSARIVEAVVQPGSLLVGRAMRGLRARRRFGINLIGLSRRGAPRYLRLGAITLAAGDVMLLQGREDRIADFLSTFGGLPLADRDIQLSHGSAALGLAILGLVVTSITVMSVPAPVAFAGGALAMVLAGFVPARRVYETIDWSVLVLLASMLPLAGALERTGTAARMVDGIVALTGGSNPHVLLAVTLIVTMTLSDIMNNAATVAVMGPVALGLARNLGAPPDAFLMAVAIGGSCAFLTPIGHQNNVLVMGPGGYRFGDYWRLGLPLEALIVAIAVPLLPRLFPH